MPAVVYAFLSTLGALFRSQLSLRVENVALRHQLAIYQRTVKRPSIRPADRILWCWLSRRWARWREVPMITKAFALPRDDRLRLNEDQQMDFGVGVFNEGSRSRDTIISKSYSNGDMESMHAF
jgi:hypothetical protein